MKEDSNYNFMALQGLAIILCYIIGMHQVLLCDFLFIISIAFHDNYLNFTQWIYEKDQLGEGRFSLYWKKVTCCCYFYIAEGWLRTLYLTDKGSTQPYMWAFCFPLVGTRDKIQGFLCWASDLSLNYSPSSVFCFLFVWLVLIVFVCF